jgi:hypothetical protein
MSSKLFWPLASICVLVILARILLNEGDAPLDTLSDLSPPGVHNHASAGEDLGGTISRESQEPSSVDLIYWRDYPNLASEFQRHFIDDFVTNGGEEATVQHVLSKTEQRKALGKWNQIPDAVSQMTADGLMLGDSIEELFKDVVYGEDFHAAGLLKLQSEAFREWKANSSNPAYHLATDRLINYPLCYPPELHFLHMVGKKEGVEFSSELLSQAAELRNLYVRESAAIELERYLMLASIIRVERKLSLDIPSLEWNDAVSELLPSYENVLESSRDVDSRYSGGLRSLLSENGYEIVNY